MDKGTGRDDEPRRAPSEQSHEYLVTGEVARLLRVPDSTVRYWRHVRVGPPSLKVGRRVLYRREAVEAWLRQREVRGAEDAVQRSGAPAQAVSAVPVSRRRQWRAP